MAAGDRVLARVREEDKTVNEGHHVPAHGVTPASFSRRDNYRCYPLANVMDYLPLPRIPLPSGNARWQALQRGPEESKARSGFSGVFCNGKGPAATGTEEDRHYGA